MDSIMTRFNCPAAFPSCVRLVPVLVMFEIVDLGKLHIESDSALEPDFPARRGMSCHCFWEWTDSKTSKEAPSRTVQSFQNMHSNLGSPVLIGLFCRTNLTLRPVMRTSSVRTSRICGPQWHGRSFACSSPARSSCTRLQPGAAWHPAKLRPILRRAPAGREVIPRSWRHGQNRRCLLFCFSSSVA